MYGETNRSSMQCKRLIMLFGVRVLPLAVLVLLANGEAGNAQIVRDLVDDSHDEAAVRDASHDHRGECELFCPPQSSLNERSAEVEVSLRITEFAVLLTVR